MFENEIFSAISSGFWNIGRVRYPTENDIDSNRVKLGPDLTKRWNRVKCIMHVVAIEFGQTSNHSRIRDKGKAN